MKPPLEVQSAFAALPESGRVEVLRRIDQAADVVERLERGGGAAAVHVWRAVIGEVAAAPSANGNGGQVAAKPEPDLERFRKIAYALPDFLKREYPKPQSLFGDGILCAGDFGILYGKPGAAKTWLALQLARAVARGEPLFGIATGAAGVRVGFLELELHATRAQDRLRALAAVGQECEDDANLSIVTRPDLSGRVNLLEAADVAALANWIRTDGLQLLIIDALSRAHEVDENQAVLFAPVLARLDELRYETGAAILPLHHEPKPKDGRAADDIDALRGTSRLQSDPNVLLRLVKLPGGKLRTLRFVKCNNAAEPDPLFLTQSDAGVLELTDPPEKIGSVNVARVQEAIEAAGATGASMPDLERATKLAERTIRAHIAKLGDAIIRDGATSPVRWKASEFATVRGDRQMETMQ